MKGSVLNELQHFRAYGRKVPETGFSFISATKFAALPEQVPLFLSDLVFWYVQTGEEGRSWGKAQSHCLHFESG